MTLSFSQKWKDGEPTYFVEKILDGLNNYYPEEKLKIAACEYNFQLKFNWTLKELENVPAKIHTIREDKTERWKTGNKIHFVINNRTKNRFQFAPIFLVKSIQTIEIKHTTLENEIKRVDLWIDSKIIGRYFPNTGQYYSSLLSLALSDGFESVKAFFEWFSEDFKGKIIHWTEHKY